MDDKLPNILLDESTARNARRNGYVNIIELKLDVFGEPVHLQIGVRDCPARLADMASLARSLSQKISRVVQRRIAGRGLTIPCHKGCTACCHFLVLISAPEAIHLVEEVVAKIPMEQREYLTQYCHEVGKRIREQLPKHLVPKSANNVSYSEMRSISDWYTRLQQPCVFLRNNLCTIYEQRPIVCRDWLVIGSASQCRLGKTGKKMAIQVPLRLSDVLRRTTSKLECGNQRGIFLHDVFTWYTNNGGLCNRTWPAMMMVERFVEIVKAMASKNSTAVVA